MLFKRFFYYWLLDYRGVNIQLEAISITSEIVNNIKIGGEKMILETVFKEFVLRSWPNEQNLACSKTVFNQIFSHSILRNFQLFLGCSLWS